MPQLSSANKTKSAESREKMHLVDSHAQHYGQRMKHMALSENESQALCQHKKWSVCGNGCFAAHMTAI